MESQSILYHGEAGFIEMMKHVLAFGVDITDRTGVGCKALFDAKIVYPSEEFACFSTFAPASPRMAFEELWFFLRGQTDTKILEEKGIFFWQGNTRREFLDKRGLEDLPEGSMGAAYSKQWRNFGGEDQLRKLIHTLTTDPYSRRMLTSLWNPMEESQMPITPCWWGCQVVVLPNKQTGRDELHMKLLNRSLDCIFGYRFAIQQYRMLQIALCRILGASLGELSVDLTHIHIYQNQIAYVEEAVERELGKQGTMELTKDIKTVEDLLALEFTDFKISGLVVNTSEFVTPRPPMAV